MGLRKLTQWEETVAKQEQKQSRLMSVAIVCVIAMCAVLWLVQDKLYGDVVRTGAAAYGCSFIGVAIGLFVRSTTGETWATSSEKRKKFEMALIGIFIVLVIGAYIPIFWILKKRKADCDENCLLACMFILMTVMVLVGTFVGVKLMGLTTLPAVEKKIAAEGFTDVEYNTWMYGRWLDLDENNEKKYYVFQAKKDGQIWQIAADPKGGQLVQITAAED